MGRSSVAMAAAMSVRIAASAAHALTQAGISVSPNAAYCKLGNGSVRNLCQDTIYVHPPTKQCNYEGGGARFVHAGNVVYTLRAYNESDGELNPNVGLDTTKWVMCYFRILSYTANAVENITIVAGRRSNQTYSLYGTGCAGRYSPLGYRHRGPHTTQQNGSVNPMGDLPEFWVRYSGSTGGSGGEIKPPSNDGSDIRWSIYSNSYNLPRPMTITVAWYALIASLDG